MKRTVAIALAAAAVGCWAVAQIQTQNLDDPFSNEPTADESAEPAPEPEPRSEPAPRVEQAPEPEPETDSAPAAAPSDTGAKIPAFWLALPE